MESNEQSNTEEQRMKEEVYPHEGIDKSVQEGKEQLSEPDVIADNAEYESAEKSFSLEDGEEKPSLTKEEGLKTCVQALEFPYNDMPMYLDFEVCVLAPPDCPSTIHEEVPCKKPKTSSS